MSMLQKINELYAEIDAEKLNLGQNRNEFRAFLEFAATYFKNRDIWRPVIVEIGVFDNCQKRFYEKLLNAEHIGIDIGYPGRPMCKPDILGDSHSVSTLEQLKMRLNDRLIDLLFIDGDHRYESVKQDYEIYGPLTQHIIALHDISTIQWTPDIPVNVKQFWEELNRDDKENMLIAIKNFNTSTTFQGHQMGIGLVIKREK